MPARRTGVIHAWDADAPADFAIDSPVPVYVRDPATREVIGRGTVASGRVEDGNLWADIDWPDEIEARAGESTPAARCKFDDAGRLVRVVVELEDDSEPLPEPDVGSPARGGRRPAPPTDPEPPSKPAPKTDRTVRTMPKTNPDIDIIFDRLSDKFDGDPVRVAKALIKQNRTMATQVVGEGQVALPKSDADLLSAYRELGDPAKLKADLTMLDGLRSLGDPAKLKAEVEALSAYRELGDPKELRSAIEGGKSLATELGGLKREKELGEVARVASYRPSVLAKLPGVDAMEFVPVARKARGQEYPSFDVKSIGPDGKEIVRPLEDVERTDWADWLPSLRSGTESGSGVASGGTGSGGAGAAGRQTLTSGFMADRGAVSATGYRPEVPRPGPYDDEDRQAKEKARAEIRRRFPASI